jgi:hypothetical protein
MISDARSRPDSRLLRQIKPIWRWPSDCIEQLSMTRNRPVQPMTERADPAPSTTRLRAERALTPGKGKLEFNSAKHLAEKNARLSRSTVQAFDRHLNAVVGLLTAGAGDVVAARQRAAQLGLPRLAEFLSRAIRAELPTLPPAQSKEPPVTQRGAASSRRGGSKR